MNWKLGQRPGSQHNKVKMTKEEKEEQEKRKAESDAAWREALGKKPRSNPVQKPMNQPKTQNSFQNGVAKAEQEIMNKANKVGVKIGNAKPGDIKVGDYVYLYYPGAGWSSSREKVAEVNDGGKLIILEKQPGESLGHHIKVEEVKK